MKYDWLAGDQQTALTDPFKVVLSERRARLYFGSGHLDDMIGRELVYDDSVHVAVAGIVRDWKENTDFPYSEFISLGSADHGFLRENLQLDQSKGIPPSSRALVKIVENTSTSRVSAAIANLFSKYRSGKSGDRISVQSLSSVHFTTYGGGRGTEFRTAHLPTLYALSGIALFILILAIVNYVNLATAQSLTRDKEIGIRKVLGSSRASVVFQFLSETLLLTLFAVCLAAFFVNPVLAVFHQFIPVGVKFEPWSSGTFLFLASITAFTTLLAGLYPARFLSSFVPILALRGAGTPKGSEKWWIRKGLIVFQFTVSLVFIIGALVIGRQIHFVLTTDLGFRSEAVVLLPTNDSRDSLNRVKLVEERIGRLPGVIGTARENIPPMGLDRAMFGIQYKARSDERMSVLAIKADENFIPLYGMRLLAGRNLSPSDTIKELIINETLSRNLGFKSPEQALGKSIYTWNKFCPIVGVVADFNQASFHEAIRPLLIAGMACTDIAIRLDTRHRSAGEVKAILGRVERQWREIYPHTPFAYTFLDESLAQLYQKEQTSAWLINIATGITIFISCIGLLGLTMFTTERRAKEISIRKVLGAGLPDIVALLSKDFVILIVLALFIASPVAWFFMHKWLQDFVYRVPFGPDIFLIAGISILFISLFTISFQSIRSALANPVKALRTE